MEKWIYFVFMLRPRNATINWNEQKARLIKHSNVAKYHTSHWTTSCRETGLGPWSGKESYTGEESPGFRETKSQVWVPAERPQTSHSTSLRSSFSIGKIGTQTRLRGCRNQAMGFACKASKRQLRNGVTRMTVSLWGLHKFLHYWGTSCLSHREARACFAHSHGLSSATLREGFSHHGDLGWGT